MSKKKKADDYDLYGGTPPSEPVSTSVAAAFAALPNINAQHRQVYAYLHQQGPQGATDDELELALGLSHQGVSARRRELVLKGLVKDSGRQRKTSRNRMAKVWVLGLDVTAQDSSGSPMLSLPSNEEIRQALVDVKNLWQTAKTAGGTLQHPDAMKKTLAWLKALSQ
jgi:hypothetical protein